MRSGSLCRRLVTWPRGIEEAIERHTRITREHLTPEIRLHLLTPDCPLYHARHTLEYFEEPFWAFYWPGGQALARYVLDEGPTLFQRIKERKGADVKVLDVGTGCGAAAIAAKLAGASDVLANDIDLVACAAVIKNARLNGVEIRVSTTDLLTRKTPELFDLILVGDLLYDEEIATRLEKWLEEQVQSEVYLADPGRHGFGPELRRKLTHLRTYRLPENVRRENYGYAEAAVWKFLPTSQR